MSLVEKRIFEEKAAFILDKAKALGADEASVSLHQTEGASVDWRMGAIEGISREQSLNIGIAVLKNKAQGMSTLSDWSEAALEAGVAAAINAASFTEADEHYGLPSPEQYAQVTAEQLAELNCDSGELPDSAWLEAQAEACEQAALAFDKRIVMSDGASADAMRSYQYKATSNGFSAGISRSQVSLSISVLARDSKDQQSDYDWDSACYRQDLRLAEDIGRVAAERALATLQPKNIQTGSYPVIFSPEMAAGLFGHLLAALGGRAQYRQLSFLNGCLEQKVLPEWLSLLEKPYLPKSNASTLFDSDGLPPAQGALIENGRVVHYLLSLYSARRLSLPPTGNASGVHNLCFEADKAYALPPQQLYQTMARGLIVTRLMGQGVNTLTGDYSRGASGFWVENGQIAYPVDGLTIAGNLRDMYQGIQAIGTDVDTRRNIRAPSVLLSPMTVAR